MINKEIVLQQLGKFFKIDNIKSINDLYDRGISDADIAPAVEFINNRMYPVDWIKKNVKIKHPAHGAQDFDLYDFQENTLKLFLAKHFLITLKSRQVGMSTLVQAICLWCALNYSNYNVLILSAKMRQATSFLGKIKYMYDNLPENEFKIKAIRNNRTEIEFANGSKIIAIPATRDSALGESINLLIIDEAGFINDIEEVYQGAYPTVSRAFKSAKGKPYGIIIISTPNGISGKGKWYYDMYSGAISANNSSAPTGTGNGFTPVKIHWSLIPEYDTDWYIDQCSKMNWDYTKIAAELELSFVSSGKTYIPGPILDTIDISEPIIKDLDNQLWIWELPQPNVAYVIGADPAFGDKGDSSALNIIRADTLEQVAEFESNCTKLDDFANIIIRLSRKYNNALTNIERNSIGKILIERILDTTNNININLYRDLNPNDVLAPAPGSDIWKKNIGTLITGQSREIILSNMYSLILDNYSEGLLRIMSKNEDAKFARTKFEDIMSGKKTSVIKKSGIIKSERLLHQLLTFVADDKGKYAGQGTDHDDIIFAWAHSLYCYTKSSALLLRDSAKLINVSVGQNSDDMSNTENLIEFMKKWNKDSTMWEINDKEIVEKLELEKLQDENTDNSKGHAKILKSFYDF